MKGMIGTAMEPGSDFYEMGSVGVTERTHIVGWQFTIDFRDVTANVALVTALGIGSGDLVRLSAICWSAFRSLPLNHVMVVGIRHRYSGALLGLEKPGDYEHMGAAIDKLLCLEHEPPREATPDTRGRANDVKAEIGILVGVAAARKAERPYSAWIGILRQNRQGKALELSDCRQGMVVLV